MAPQRDAITLKQTVRPLFMTRITPALACFGQKFLSKPTTVNQWFQPTQDTENALIHQQNINFVADRDYQSATVQGNGALALTETAILISTGLAEAALKAPAATGDNR